jgi:hypothetical protein
MLSLGDRAMARMRMRWSTGRGRATWPEAILVSSVAFIIWLCDRRSAKRKSQMPFRDDHSGDGDAGVATTQADTAGKPTPKPRADG